MDSPRFLQAKPGWNSDTSHTRRGDTHACPSSTWLVQAATRLVQAATRLVQTVFGVSFHDKSMGWSLLPVPLRLITTPIKAKHCAQRRCPGSATDCAVATPAWHCVHASTARLSNCLPPKRRNRAQAVQQLDPSVGSCLVLASATARGTRISWAGFAGPRNAGRPVPRSWSALFPDDWPRAASCSHKRLSVSAANIVLMLVEAHAMFVP